jgi:hypothetical protein
MKKFFVWLQEDEGWKSILAIVYAVICLFDFIISPILWNLRREEAMLMANAIAHDPLLNAQLAADMLNAVYRAHVPYTLQGNGIFHLAFGALLTGSAISKFKEKI